MIGDIERDYDDNEVQYIGVGVRDADDLSDGYAMVSMYADFRNMLYSLVDEDVVIESSVVGMPEYSFVVDKKI